MADCDHVFAMTPFSERGRPIEIEKLRMSKLDTVRKNMRACQVEDVAEARTTQERTRLRGLSDEQYFRDCLICLDYCPDCGTKNAAFPFPEKTDG